MTDPQIKKLQDQLDKHEKTINLLINRIRVLEVQAKKQHSAIIRAHSTIATHERQIGTHTRALNSRE